MAPSDSAEARNILITGGAGFIGSNLAARLLATDTCRITVFDNLSLPGSDANLAWLQSQAAPGRLSFVHGDLRTAAQVRAAVADADAIYHLACRCAQRPDRRADYDVNVTGTGNVLDAASTSGRHPFVLYLSTAKVYTGALDLALQEEDDRLQPANPNFAGFSEGVAADCDNPFTCSRGAADRMVRDYSSLHGLAAAVLRLDTAAGPRQFANEEHGWVAHLVDCLLSDRPVRVFGSGRQVHDVLHVADVVDAMLVARAYMGVTAGKVYNIGAGPDRAVSVRQVVQMIQRLCYRAPQVHHEPARAGDMLYFAADASAFHRDTGWRPRHSLEQTIRDIVAFWHATHVKAMPPKALTQPVVRHRHAA